MSPTTSTGRRTLVVAVALLASLSAMPAAAQNGGNPNILQKLGDLQEAVVSLQSTANTLLTEVESLTGETVEKNVRVTAPVFAPGGVTVSLAACPVNNVSSESRTIQIQLVGPGGSSDTRTLGAGVSALVVSAFGQGGLVYCRFTVVNGTKGDIRGGLEMSTGGLSLPFLFIVAE